MWNWLPKSVSLRNNEQRCQRCQMNWYSKMDGIPNWVGDSSTWNKQLKTCVTPGIRAEYFHALSKQTYPIQLSGLTRFFNCSVTQFSNQFEIPHPIETSLKTAAPRLINYIDCIYCRIHMSTRSVPSTPRIKIMWFHEISLIFPHQNLNLAMTLYHDWDFYNKKDYYTLQPPKKFLLPLTKKTFMESRQELEVPVICF